VDLHLVINQSGGDDVEKIGTTRDALLEEMDAW
jgi:hypothetical protein